MPVNGSARDYNTISNSFRVHVCVCVCGGVVSWLCVYAGRDFMREGCETKSR